MKERILQQAEKMFTRYGIRNISMDTIARELSISKKTIYQYFQDKDDLVMQVATLHHQRDIDQLAQLLQEKTDLTAIDELLLIADYVAAMIRHINPAYLYDMQKFHETAWKVCQQQEENFIHRAIRNNLQKGMTDGLYRNDLNIEIMLRLILFQNNIIADPHYFPEKDFHIIEVHQQVVKHFIYGIVNEKGFQHLEIYSNNSNKNTL
ncbi:MAG: TetR/AcrR family transcriptional regulator [Cytophagales bacterium]|nr:MAG: TetR/AcrR family transcriptional regulator [Cytophagales bacterium]